MTSSITRQMSTDVHQTHGSFELVLSPLLLGLLGWWLDAKVLHTTPLCTVIFSVGALIGVVVKIYYGYRATMAELTEKSAWVGLARERRAATDAGNRAA